MGRDLVQQQERRAAALGAPSGAPGPAGWRSAAPSARRSSNRAAGMPRRAMADREDRCDEARQWRRPRLRHRARGSAARRCAQAVLGRRAPAPRRASPRPSPASARSGRGKGADAPARSAASSRPTTIAAARRRWRRRARPSASSSARQPGRIAVAALAAQQPRALAQRLLVGVDAAGMAGIEAETSRSRKRRRAERTRGTAGPSAASARARARRSAERRSGCAGGAPSMRTDAARGALVRLASRPVPIADRGRCRSRARPSAVATRGRHRPGGSRRPAAVVGAGRSRQPRPAQAAAREPGTRALPADWSCRRRWARSAPPAGCRPRGAAPA